MDNDIRRNYEETHGFIKFRLNLERVLYTLWILFGAAESKCKHLSGIPLRPEKQEELNQISLKKGVQATTAIEGNTLSLEDVDLIYNGGRENIPQSRQYQAQEIKNVLNAYNGIIQNINDHGICEVSLATLEEDNRQVLDGLELQDDIIPGEIRTYPVTIGNYYRGAPAEDCRYLLDRLFAWLSEDWGLSAKYPLIEGILKAILGHIYIAWIHPFGDGNGRSARLLEFRLLMRAGVPLTAAHLLTTFYNDTRERYYDTLVQSSRVENGELAFIHYAVEGFVDALDRQIGSILEEQLDITWENYIHEVCFGGKLTAALRRRRDLLLEISHFTRPLTVKELRYRVSDDVLKQYQGSTKMLMRDINYLLNAELVYKTTDGYLAAKDKMKAFLPLKI